LLLWRHRFITDTWGYEIPAGSVDDGENLQVAAEREVLEETGWAATALRPTTHFHPTNGLSDQIFHIFEAREASYVGDPSDPSESVRVEWVPRDRVRQLLVDNQVTDGMSLTALAHWFLTA
jgi:8-oxo-dGTP pyrophosphatase MutT (NUDIX family)